MTEELEELEAATASLALIKEKGISTSEATTQLQEFVKSSGVDELANPPPKHLNTNPYKEKLKPRRTRRGCVLS